MAHRLAHQVDHPLALVLVSLMIVSSLMGGAGEFVCGVVFAGRAYEVGLFRRCGSEVSCVWGWGDLVVGTRLVTNVLGEAAVVARGGAEVFGSSGYGWRGGLGVEGEWWFGFAVVDDAAGDLVGGAAGEVGGGEVGLDVVGEAFGVVGGEGEVDLVAGVGVDGCA